MLTFAIAGLIARILHDWYETRGLTDPGTSSSTSREPVRSIAARIGKSYQTVYREIARNRKPDGRYQPWYAHTKAYQRRRRPKPRRVSVDAALRTVIADRLASHWSPGQIGRWLRRRWPKRAHWSPSRSRRRTPRTAWRNRLAPAVDGRLPPLVGRARWPVSAPNLQWQRRRRA